LVLHSFPTRRSSDLSRDIFGGSSHRVVGPTRNRNSRTSQHSTSLFPGASILEDRRLLDSALLGSYNICTSSTLKLFQQRARRTRTLRVWGIHRADRST